MRLLVTEARNPQVYADCIRDLSFAVRANDTFPDTSQLQFPALERLVLGLDPQYGSCALVSVSQFLQPKLTSLRIICTSEGAMITKTENFLHNFPQLDALTKLDLLCRIPGAQPQQLRNALTRCPNLQKVFFGSALEPLMDGDVYVELARKPLITRLRLESVTSRDTMRYVDKTVPQPFPSIRELALAVQGSTGEDMFIRRLHTLKSLQLAAFDDTPFYTIFDTLPQVESIELGLSDTLLTHNDLSRMERANLHTLAIIPINPDSEAPLARISPSQWDSFLAGCPKLRHLDVSHIDAGMFFAGHMPPLEALRCLVHRCPHLEVLNFASVWTDIPILDLDNLRQVWWPSLRNLTLGRIILPPPSVRHFALDPRHPCHWCVVCSTAELSCFC